MHLARAAVTFGLVPKNILGQRDMKQKQGFSPSSIINLLSFGRNSLNSVGFFLFIAEVGRE